MSDDDLDSMFTETCGGYESEETIRKNESKIEIDANAILRSHNIKLEKEVEELKAKLHHFPNYCSNCGKQLK